MEYICEYDLRTDVTITDGVIGNPPTKVQSVAAATEALIAKPKSRPAILTPSLIGVDVGIDPLTLLPMATGAVVMVLTGPNFGLLDCILREIVFLVLTGIVA